MNCRSGIWIVSDFWSKKVVELRLLDKWRRWVTDDGKLAGAQSTENRIERKASPPSVRKSCNICTYMKNDCRIVLCGYHSLRFCERCRGKLEVVRRNVEVWDVKSLTTDANGINLGSCRIKQISRTKLEFENLHASDGRSRLIWLTEISRSCCGEMHVRIVSMLVMYC